MSRLIRFKLLKFVTIKVTLYEEGKKQKIKYTLPS